MTNMRKKKFDVERDEEMLKKSGSAEFYCIIEVYTSLDLLIMIPCAARLSRAIRWINFCPRGSYDMGK